MLDRPQQVRCEPQDMFHLFLLCTANGEAHSRFVMSNSRTTSGSHERNRSKEQMRGVGRRDLILIVRDCKHADVARTTPKVTQQQNSLVLLNEKHILLLYTVINYKLT